MKIDFDEKKHLYQIDGQKVKSVTQILKEEGFIDFSKVPAAILDAAANFGRAVHKATALYDSDDLDYSTLDKELEPYLDGWIKFKKDTGITFSDIETPIASKRLMLAGTPDRNRAIFHDKLTIVEIKSVTVFSRAIALQLAGYELIENEGKKVKDKIKQKVGVRLKGDGDYELTPKTYFSPYDTNIFLGALLGNRWKEENLR